MTTCQECGADITAQVRSAIASINSHPGRAGRPPVPTACKRCGREWPGYKASLRCPCPKMRKAPASET